MNFDKETALRAIWDAHGSQAWSDLVIYYAAQLSAGSEADRALGEGLRIQMELQEMNHGDKGREELNEQWRILCSIWPGLARQAEAITGMTFPIYARSGHNPMIEKYIALKNQKAATPQKGANTFTPPWVVK